MAPENRKNIADFPYGGVIDYPGLRNSTNFILDNGQIIDLPEDTSEALIVIDELLEQKHLPVISERVPVLAFGRNAGPEGLYAKMKKYEAFGDLVTIVPTLRSVLHGHDVVWHGRPGQSGGYFAELFTSEDTTKTSVEAWVQFLTPEQLAIIHTTEGVTYEVTEVPDVSLGKDLAITVVAYTSREASMLLDSSDGKPIAVAGVERHQSDLEVMDVREVLQYTLGQESVKRALGGAYSVDAFLEEGAIMNLADKKRRQASVHQALMSIGVSRPFRYPGQGVRHGRASLEPLPRGLEGTPASHHTLRLMEEQVAAIRPTEDMISTKVSLLRHKYPELDDTDLRLKALKLLDPVQTLRIRAHDELLDFEREQQLRKLTGANNESKQSVDNEAADV